MYLTNICVNVTEVHTFTDTEKLHKATYMRKTVPPQDSLPSKPAPYSSLCAHSVSSVLRFPLTSPSSTLAWGLQQEVSLPHHRQGCMHVYTHSCTLTSHGKLGENTSNIKLRLIFISRPMYMPGTWKGEKNRPPPPSSNPRHKFLLHRKPE